MQVRLAPMIGSFSFLTVQLSPFLPPPMLYQDSTSRSENLSVSHWLFHSLIDSIVWKSFFFFKENFISLNSNSQLKLSVCWCACVFTLLEEVMEKMWPPVDPWAGPGPLEARHPSLDIGMYALPMVPSLGAISRTQPLWPMGTILFDLSGVLVQKKLQTI